MVKPCEVTTIAVPQKNVTARMMMVVRRPIASATFPQINAPKAAANTSELRTTPTWRSLRPISCCIGRSAPFATPVS